MQIHEKEHLFILINFITSNCRIIKQQSDKSAKFNDSTHETHFDFIQAFVHMIKKIDRF